MRNMKDFLNYIGQEVRKNWKLLLWCVLIGSILTSLFSGKSNVELNAITVSPNEQFVACFGNNGGNKIHCFHADGTLSFVYDIPLELSSGGHCVLWFENNVLCALFYRTNKIVSFSMDGSVLSIADDVNAKKRPEYPSFSRQSHQYVYEGNEIDVVYDTGGFFGYWILGAERYLAITLKNGETIKAIAWVAQNQ